MLRSSEIKEFPNVLVVGAAKSGTTSVYDFFKCHPKVFVNEKIKEPSFFCAHLVIDKSFIRNDVNKVYDSTVITSLNEYLNLFNIKKDEKYIADCSTNYLYFYEESIKNIKNYIGDPRIIIIKRDSLERAYSAYLHLKRQNCENLSFIDALQIENKRKSNNFHHMYHYRSMSIYSDACREYKKNFSNVLILNYSEIKNRTAFAKICNFLNIGEVEDRTTWSNKGGMSRFPIINEVFFSPTIVASTVRNVIKLLLPKILRHYIKSMITNYPKLNSEEQNKIEKLYEWEFREK